MTIRICHQLLSVLSVAVFSGAVLALLNSAARAETPRKLQPRTSTQTPEVNIPPRTPSAATSPQTTQVPTAASSSLARSNKRLEELDRQINAARDRSKALTDKAQSLDANIQTLRQGMVSAARLIQYHESRVTELTLQLDELNRIAAEKEKVLKHRRKQIGRVILALHKVAQYPPESLLVSPIEPGDAVRSAILLRSTMPELESRALILREDLRVLNETRAEAAKQKIELSAASTELESQRKLLRNLIGRKSRLRRRTLAKSDQAKKKVRSLANQARSIRDLMARLEVLRKKREQQAEEQAKAIARSQAEQENNPQAAQKLVEEQPNLQRPSEFTGKDLATARGKLPYPAVGPVVAKFGDKAKSGLHHKGLTIETSSGAQVIAPYEGRVAFSGPFRGYGELLIIEHREGYHTLLAGMSRIDGVVGQWLLAGEPVGVMENAQSAAKQDKPTLYLEMRHKGQPINPLPWLASREG